MKKRPNPQIILALDVDTLESAKNFINRLYPKIKIFKVGSHLFTAYGPKIIELLNKRCAQVFLDLKYFDIPNTVANAVAAACRLKVKMLTLHITGGPQMITAAVDAANRYGKKNRPLLLGITVLTSQPATVQRVLSLAKQGLEYGLDGVVCSVKEAAFLRKKINRDFFIVTPGIRPNDCAADDQKRTASVRQALVAGSDFLVIGRPILKAQDPVKKAEEFLGDLSLFREGQDKTAHRDVAKKYVGGVPYGRRN